MKAAQEAEDRKKTADGETEVVETDAKAAEEQNKAVLCSDAVGRAQMRLGFAQKRCVEADVRLTSMIKHLAEKDTIEAETKAKAAWCGAEVARTAVVQAMLVSCEDPSIIVHKTEAVTAEAEGREQTSYGWSAAARPNLPTPNTCGGC